MASTSDLQDQRNQRETYESTTARILSDPGLPNERPSESYWQLPAHPLSHVKSETLRSETDVVIIGSGIAGCSVSYSLLKDPSFTGKIVVLEARTLCSGATGRNGGHIATHPVIDYSEFLALGIQPEEAKKICHFQLSHFDMILADLEDVDRESKGVENGKAGKVQSLVERSEIRRVISHCGISGEEKVKEMSDAYGRLEKEVPELKGRAKFYSSKEKCSKLKMPGVNAIITEPAGACWPYRLVTSLFAHLLNEYPQRFSIETETPVSSVSSSLSSGSGDGYRYAIATSRGTIGAKKVVYCTNAHTTHLLPSLRGKIYPVQGHMSVQIPGPSFPHPSASTTTTSSLISKITSFFVPSQSPPSTAPPTKSWSMCYDNFGLDYLTQNLKSGELFYGGGLVKGMYGGLKALGNPDDSDAAEDVLTGFHLKNSLPKWFGLENWGFDDVDSRVKSSWTGVMGFTGDLLPLVGKVPSGVASGDEGKDEDGKAEEEKGEGEEWIAAGFNGYGMVNCWGSGKALVSMILNQSPPESFPHSYILTKERLAKMRAEAVVEGLLGSEEK